MAKEPFVEQLTSKWVGAIFFWLLNGFRGKYSDQLIPKYQKRNLWTGYVISLLFFFAIIYFFVLK